MLVDGGCARGLSHRREDARDIDARNDVSRDSSREEDANVIPDDDTVAFRFSCAEEFVEHMIHQGLQCDEERIIQRDHEKEVSLCEKPSNKNDDNKKHTDMSIQSKRKVSDVDEPYRHEAKKPRIGYSFPSHLVQLARSNIILLRRKSTPKDQSALLEETTTTQYPQDHSLSTESDLQHFLRYPQLQKQNNQAIMALPRLLQTNITDEATLRHRSHTICTSILNKYSNLNTPLQIFLGYKSTNNKCVDREKLIAIFSDVLFDVSHAMYAWIQTEKEMMMMNGFRSNENHHHKKKKKGHIPIPGRCVNVKTIKDALFDDRAIKRIGGFESFSLLPLALGVRYCEENTVTWEEYALSTEGREAFEIHYQKNGKCKKREYKDVLFEIGKARRGRRGRSFRNNSRVIEPSYVVG